MNTAVTANCWSFAFFTIAHGPYVDGWHPETPKLYPESSREAWRTSESQITVRQGYSSGTVGVKLYCAAGSPTFSLWIDNVSMEEVVAT